MSDFQLLLYYNKNIIGTIYKQYNKYATFNKSSSYFGGLPIQNCPCSIADIRLRIRPHSAHKFLHFSLSLYFRLFPMYGQANWVAASVIDCIHVAIASRYLA